MSVVKGEVDRYRGFEQGPIRSPSEAYSLLIRVTRNCPWNRCSFCPVYKGTKFSRRPVEHVKRDIDAVYRQVETLRTMGDEAGRVRRSEVNRVLKDGKPLTELKDGDDVQKCIECHKTPGEAPKGKKAKKKLSKKEKIAQYHAEAVHANCRGCHKDFNKKYKPKKAPTTCAKCHPKTKK